MGCQARQSSCGAREKQRRWAGEEAEDPPGTEQMAVRSVAGGAEQRLAGGPEALQGSCPAEAWVSAVPSQAKSFNKLTP